jgi:hypothetical protein
MVDVGEQRGADVLAVEDEVRFTNDSAASQPAASANLAPVNAVCPVTGAAVDPKFAIVFEGRVIGFCCPNCPQKFWAEPETFRDKLK